MIKLVYLLFLVLFAFSCKSHDSNLYVIDPRKFVENKIVLSEIADDITYIPLDNKIPFSYFKYIITPNSLYVSAKGIGILKFDREGRQLKKIGSRGRGPGEFWYGMNFTVDDRTGNVFVLDPGIIIVYSQSGNFLRDIKTKEYSSGFGFNDVEINNSLLFFPDFIPTGDSKNSWVFLDTLGKLVAKKENSVPIFENNIEMDGCIYKFENKIFYLNYFNDTIFSISPDLSSSAAYLFAKGEFRRPKKKIEFSSTSQFFSELFKFFKPAAMFETKLFIVLAYSYHDKFVISFIDKKTKKTFIAQKHEETQGMLIKYKPFLMNDLDGGMPLTGDFRYYSENGTEYITTLINALDLKTYISNDEFKNAVPKYHLKKKELEKLANNMAETDNPILMMVRLKK